MYVFENYQEINLKNRNLRNNKIVIFIKIKFQRILKVIRARLKNRRILSELKYFSDFVVNSYEHLDRSYIDTTGQQNTITLLKKNIKATNVKTHYDLNKIDYFKTFMFFQINLCIGFKGKYYIFKVDNFYARQKSFKSFQIGFEVLNKKLYKFSFE